MTIEVVHTPQGGQVGRGAGGRFVSLGTKPLPKKIVPTTEAYTEGMELSGGASGGAGAAALGGGMAVAGFHAMVFALQAISDKIDTLIGVTQEALGIDKQENRANELEAERDAQDRRDERLEERDRDKKDKGKTGPGILGSIGDMFKSFGGFIKDKAMGLGDFVKMFLFAGGLYLLSKYSDQLVKYLSPILKYFKEDFLPDMEEFGTWVVDKLAPFVKQSWLFIKNTLAPAIKKAALWFTEMTTTSESFEDEFGRMHQKTGPGVLSLDWDKIKTALAIGIGAYLTLKFLPLILWGVGGALLSIPGLGLAVGIVGLGAYLIWSAIKMAGQAILDSADWTKEKGATDDSNANAVGSFFGGKIEGGWRNAIQNAGKWGKYFGIAGFTIGLFGGPIGALAGGVLGVAIGVIFGGILGLIGGGWIAKIYKWIKDSIINIADKTKAAILNQEELAAKRDIILDETSGLTKSQKYAAAGFDISHPRFMKQTDPLWKSAGMGIDDAKEAETFVDTLTKTLDFATTSVDISKLEGWKDNPVQAIDTRLGSIENQLRKEASKLKAVKGNADDEAYQIAIIENLKAEKIELIKKRAELTASGPDEIFTGEFQKIAKSPGKTRFSGPFMDFNESFAYDRMNQMPIVIKKDGDINASTANQYIGPLDVNNNGSINGLNITLELAYDSR